MQNEFLLRGSTIWKLLKPYQKDFLKASLPFLKYACCIQIGGGKTFSAIAWMNYHFYKQDFKKCIIFAPANKLSDWQRDLNGQLGNIKDAFIPFKVRIIKNAYDFKKLANDDYNNHVFIASISLLSQKKFIALMRDHTYTNFLKDLGYVFDESSNMRYYTSNISKNFVVFNYYCKYGLLLSGSVIGNGLQDAFVQGFLLGVQYKLTKEDITLQNQIYKSNVNTSPLNDINDDTNYQILSFKDYMDLFNKQYEVFKNIFLIEKDIKIKYKKNNKEREYKVKKPVGVRLSEVLIHKLQKKMFIIESKLETSHEKIKDQRVQITKHDTFVAYENVVLIKYKEMFMYKDEEDIDFRDDLMMFFSLYNLDTFGVNAFKLAQTWCSGFMHFTDAIYKKSVSLFDKFKDAKPPNYLFNDTNLKPKHLLNYLKSNNFPNVIIFYNFNLELEQIKQVGKSLNYSICEINGQNKYESFTKTNKMMLIVHYRSGSAGLNLQSYANHLIFYAPSLSYDAYVQAKGRIVRKGQSQNCYITNFILADSLESEIWYRLQKRKQIMDALFTKTDTINDISKMQLEKDTIFNASSFDLKSQNYEKNKDIQNTNLQTDLFDDVF